MSELRRFGDTKRRPGIILLLCAVVLFGDPVAARADWNFKQIAAWARGTGAQGQVVPYRRSSTNNPILVAVDDYAPTGMAGIAFYRYMPLNRYPLIKIDTLSWDPGIHPGNYVPWACGDVDGDSLNELVCENREILPSGQERILSCLYVPPSQSICPDSLVWHDAYDSNTTTYGNESFYAADLDQDGKKEVIALLWQRRRFMTWECVAGDSLRRMSWLSDIDGGRLGIGDFDGDGRVEAGTAGLSWNNQVTILKCTGNDTVVLWEQAPIHLPNGGDVFSSPNIDGQRHAALFVSFWSVSGTAWLYQFEPTQGTHGYQPFLVDSTTVWSGDIWGVSNCSDIDGDGKDEIVWSCGTQLQVYRYIAPHQFERVWYWPTSANFTSVNLCDVNNNGYSEILESDCDLTGHKNTHVFEIEAIRVLNPDRYVWLRPGDTCRIRWQTFTPPRCDSVSLFLRQPPLLNLDTLVHGLSPAETSWLWTVPHIISDSCRVFAIAYGPGWQYDESDSCFRIAPVGVEGWPSEATYETKLIGASPNPLTGATSIQFELREQGQVSLRVCDVSGRTVATLADGSMKPGIYRRDWEVAPTVPNGVYFLDFAAGAYKTTRKLVLAR